MSVMKYVSVLLLLVFSMVMVPVVAAAPVGSCGSHRFPSTGLRRGFLH